MSHSRTSLVVFVCSLAAVPLAHAAAAMHGAVVDPSGHPVPRAHVRVVDASGRELASTFADERGQFETPSADNCRIEASLQGFETATAPCATNDTVRIALALAPISEQVVVTATNTLAPASQIGASTSVFTAEDLTARREPLVADLLRTTPGAMVIRTGGPGGQTSLFVRGGESNYNKVLIDGIPINEPGGAFYFNNLTTDNLDRIEVVRGAQSALFGSDAMASVVQLFTKRGDRLDPRVHGAASIEAGTFGTMSSTATLNGASAKADYTFGANRLSTDNEGPNHRFENTALTFNAGVDLGGGATLRALGRAELQHSGTPGPTVVNPPDLDGFFERHDGLGGLTFDQTVSPRFHQRAVYSYGVSNQVSTDLVADSPSDYTYDSTTNLRRHFASYQADVKLPAAAGATHEVSFIADWNGERAHVVDRMAFTPEDADFRHARNNFGVALQEQAMWSRVFLTAGGRVEHNSSFGTVAVPRGSLVLVAHQGGLGETRLHGSAGLGIKEPTVVQSFSLNPYFTGNPDLKPERSTSLEAGIEQRLAGNRTKLEATWFDARYRNQITLPGTVFENVARTRARGAEIGVEIAPASILRVSGGYTFLDAFVVTAGSSSTQFQPGSALFRRPRHSGYLAATLAVDRLSVNVSGSSVGHFLDSDFTTTRTENPGYAVWNGRATVTLTKQLSLLAAIDNIADTSYEEPLGYPELGRALRFGLKAGF